jgi:hypothetical protein
MKETVTYQKLQQYLKFQYFILDRYIYTSHCWRMALEVADGKFCLRRYLSVLAIFGDGQRIPVVEICFY